MDYVGIIKERKVIDGKLYRRYFIDSEGKEIGIPSYVRLVSVGNVNYVSVHPNQNKFPGSGTVHEAYTDAVTQEIKLKRAIVTVKNLLKEDYSTAQRARTSSKKNDAHILLGIDEADIPVGVSIQVRKGNNVFITLAVSFFDSCKKKFSAKAIYVGTLNNWKERYPTKLQEAITLREESLKLYNELTKVN